MTTHCKTMFAATTALLALLGSTGTGVARADGPAGGPHHGGKKAAAAMTPDAVLQKMTRNLGLSAAQQSRIRPIVADMMTQIRAAVQDTSLDKPGKMDRIGQIRQSAFARIRPLLSAAQQKKLDEARAKTGKPGGAGKTHRTVGAS